MSNDRAYIIQPTASNLPWALVRPQHKNSNTSATDAIERCWGGAMATAGVDCFFDDCIINCGRCGHITGVLADVTDERSGSLVVCICG